MANTLNNHFTMNIMPDDLMTLRDLRVQTFKERREGRLTTLPPNFYKRVRTLEMKIKEIITNSKEDPKKFDKANSDIRKFLDMKLELHKHRERKLTDLAREKINGQNPDTTNVHKNEIEYHLKPLIYDIHRNYLENKSPTTWDDIKQYIHTIPSKKLMFALNYC